MPFHQSGDLMEDYERHSATKLGGLLRLLMLGANVPAFGALLDGEIAHYQAVGRISKSATDSLQLFVDALIGEGHAPLFALRFDYKTDADGPRPPVSLLNVGQHCQNGMAIKTANGSRVDLASFTKLEAGRQFMFPESSSINNSAKRTDSGR